MRRLLTERAKFNQLGEINPIARELTDRDIWAIERQRWEYDVDARAVLQPRVHHWSTLVDAPSDTHRDALTHMRHVPGIAKLNTRQLQLPAPLDEDLLRTVHHDVGDRVVLEQRFERPQAEHVV